MPKNYVHSLLCLCSVLIFLVVTGCSKGIGLCYAQELAKKGMNLVLIARKAELLNKIAEELRNQHDIQVEVIIADFGKGANIYSSIEEKLVGKDIGILVNNVGVATDGIRYFHEASEDSLWNMINVNIGSMTLMCKMILPKMEERKRGAVINVASVASFAPNPLMTMYAATKAYVNFFSRGKFLQFSSVRELWHPRSSTRDHRFRPYVYYRLISE